METLFTFLKKGLVTTVFTMFAFAAVYVPQDWNHIEEAQAGGFTNISTETTQILNNIELLFIDAMATLTEGWTYVTSSMTSSLWVKESVLDGIAWALAKSFISSMVDSLINWINSGFKGSPMFVQDLSRFLTDVADRVMGEYIQNLGGLGSFICDPFKLDIQIALALQYQRQRIDQPAPTCTLSGLIDNIEGFLDGAQGSFGEGGWNDWFDITSQPETYTPYGATLAAQTGAQMRILNAKGEEAFKLEWGDGFLSGEICQAVSGPSGDTEECFITKPGKIIEEALSFNLDSGRQSLITADEMNEIISALFGQLANTALTGAAGLLGLSGGTGYTYAGFNAGSYTSQMNNESSSITTSSGLSTLENSRDLETDYRNLALSKKAELQVIAASTTAPANIVAAASTAITETDAVIFQTTGNLLELNSLIASYSATNDPTEQGKIMQEYYKLPLFSPAEYNNSENSWNAIINSAHLAAANTTTGGTTTSGPTVTLSEEVKLVLNQKYITGIEDPNIVVGVKPGDVPTDLSGSELVSFLYAMRDVQSGIMSLASYASSTLETVSETTTYTTSQKSTAYAAAQNAGAVWQKAYDYHSDLSTIALNARTAGPAQVSAYYGQLLALDPYFIADAYDMIDDWAPAAGPALPESTFRGALLDKIGAFDGRI